MAFKQYLKEMDEANFNALNAFVFDLLFFSSQVHIWHLQTGSYAAHMALKDLYEGIPDLVDDIAEAIIGTNRKLTIPAKTFSFVDNIVDIESICSSINTFKLNATQLSSSDELGVENTLADIVSLLDKTVYKLKNLK